MLVDERDILMQTVHQAEWDAMTEEEKRRSIAAFRLNRWHDAALARAAVAVAERTATEQVLVPTTHIVRRVGYFLRMCECGHAGRANFHNGDESAAFELIGSPTWRCGFCLTDKPNPGKDDAEYALATHPPKRDWRMGFTDEQLEDGDERCDERMGN